MTIFPSPWPVCLSRSAALGIIIPWLFHYMTTLSGLCNLIPQREGFLFSITCIYQYEDQKSVGDIISLPLQGSQWMETNLFLKRRATNYCIIYKQLEFGSKCG